MADSSISSDSSTSTVSAAAAQPTRKRRRRVVWILLSLLGAVIAIFLVLAVRVAIPAYAGYQAAGALLNEVQNGLDTVDPQKVEQALADADMALDSVTANLAPFRPLLRSLNLVPTWGATLAATPELLAVLQPLSDIAQEVAPLAGIMTGDGDLLERGAALASALAADPERVARMADHMEAASAALDRLPVETLHPALAGRLALAAPLLERAPELLPGLAGIPTLLGMEKPHTLLLLLQNNHELRATGGFLTAVGRVTLDQGQIVELQFDDAYVVFDREKRYPPAPPPMQQYMQIPYLTFRDANWSPDLPKTAQVAGTFYTADIGQSFDDLVTIDLNAVQLLIEALSPLKLEGVDEPVTGANILTIMKELWARPADSDVTIDENIGQWWRERKMFIPRLAQAALQKLLTGAEPLRLANALFQALDQRSIQVVIQEPALSAVLAAQHWDGSLQPGPMGSDFIALVDTNMGYNKADAVIERSLAYTLTVPEQPGEGAQAEIAVTYRHPLDVEDPGCDQTPRYGKSYDDMIARCYFVYTRLYVPAGSTLIDATGVPSDTVTSQRGENGTQFFGSFLILPPNSQATIRWRYTLPQEIQLAPDAYSLVVQKQAGLGTLPLSLNIGGRSDTLQLEMGRLEWSMAP